jgi:1,4-dihydroxy-2-naphthoate octaprenyltransferase
MSTASIPSLTSRQVWILAVRPKTLPAAAATAITGSSAAFYASSFKLLPALVCLLIALLLQIGANLANDVYDYKRGTDTTARLGPLRVTHAGYLTPRQVLMGMWFVFGAAGILGIYLFFQAGWPVLVIGLLSIAAAIAYSGGSLPYGYYGLGDLAVFIFFGFVAVCGTYYVQVLTIDPIAIWASMPMAFLIVAILVVNNLRDVPTDRVTGKRTLAVRFGVGFARWEYAACLLAAYLAPALMVVVGVCPAWVLLAWLSLPIAFKQNQMVWQLEGRPLNQTLAGTGQLTLLFATIFSLGMIISAIT